MRILWLCNVVLPDFCKEFGIKKTNVGGWMSGMLSALERQNSIEIALAFPIIDKWRMKDGRINGHPFFSFSNEHNDDFELREQRKNRLREIVRQYKPDIVHIWGTEFPWALEMTEVCKECALIDNAFVHIQGLTSNIAKHYFSGIPIEYWDKQDEYGNSIRKDQLSFQRRGDNEIKLIQAIKNVGIRTEWDKACCYAINRECQYYTSHEVLREDFYKNVGSWDYKHISPHTVFVSQATYPIKGFHYVLEAMTIIKREFDDLHVYVGGTDIIHEKSMSSYAQFLNELINKYELSDNITFCGILCVEDMIKMYRNSHVFVSASCVENSSNSIAEAMMIGTPIVSSYVGGVATFLINRYNALVYPENETDLLAFHIIDCFRSRNLCEKLSTTEVETAEKLVSIEKGKQDLLSIYKTILNS